MQKLDGMSISGRTTRRTLFGTLGTPTSGSSILIGNLLFWCAPHEERFENRVLPVHPGTLCFRSDACVFGSQGSPDKDGSGILWRPLHVPNSEREEPQKTQPDSDIFFISSYKWFVGDGDSKNYEAICKCYGDTVVEKLEDKNHFSKRFKRRINTIRNGNKSLMGRGKLTTKQVCLFSMGLFLFVIEW